MKAGIVIGLIAAAGVLGACLTSQAQAGLPAGALGMAQAGPAAGAGAGDGSTILATGGSSDSKSDILWVLTKVKPVRGPERMVLAMYKVEEQGKGFSLKGARMLDADLRCVDLQTQGKVFSVNDIIKALPKEEADALRPPATNAERP